MNLYDVLGVAPGASLEQVTEAYRLRARECHPDVDDSPEAAARFHDLSAAFRTLSDPARRRDYDTFLAAEGEIPMPVPTPGGTTGATPAPGQTEGSAVVIAPPPAEPPESEPAPVAFEGRVRRHARRRRMRIWAAGIAAAVVVIAGLSWLALSGGSDGTEDPEPSPSIVLGRSDLTLFSVAADPPFAAIVGTGGDRPPVVVAVPYNLITPPGAGGGTIGQAFSESGDTGRTVVANVAGAWIPTYAQVSTRALSDIVAQRGGLDIDLASAQELGKRMVGPGPTRLSGSQVVDYLGSATGNERNLRWEEVLLALFAGAVPLPDDADTNDAGEAASALDAAKGATVSELPTEVAEGPYRKVNVLLMEEGMQDLFGVQSGERVNVSIFVGVDRPGLSERATEALVPRGFHIAGYQDTKGLDKGRVSENTIIYYHGDEMEEPARRVQQALGLGKVVLSELDSGVANIDVTLGKDYAASLGG